MRVRVRVRVRVLASVLTRLWLRPPTPNTDLNASASASASASATDPKIGPRLVLITSAEVLTGGESTGWQQLLVQRMRRRIRASLAHSPHAGGGGDADAPAASGTGDSRGRIDSLALALERRVLFLAHLPTPTLFQLYSMPQVAAVVDTFPFGGGMTALEALGLGVPVLTLPSRQTVPQLAAGMYRKMRALALAAAAASDNSTEAGGTANADADTLKLFVPTSWRGYTTLASRLAFDLDFHVAASAAIRRWVDGLFSDAGAVAEWAALLRGAAALARSR